MTLQEAILQVVDDNSGGIKFTELVAKITAMAFERGIDGFKPKQGPDAIEKAVEDCPYLRVLEYHMNMGNVKRQKLFIYRP